MWRIPYSGRASESLPVPPGLGKAKEESELDGVSLQIQHEKEVAAKNKHCMNLAIGPGKSLLQTAFMLWMSGSSIQIFSIYTTGNALINPLKGIGNMSQVFGKFDKEEGVDTRLPKLVFVALQLLSVGVALYKCAMMSLLPLTSADWVWRLGGRTYEETAGIPVL
jgi:ER membrane protein complex subunit 4